MSDFANWVRFFEQVGRFSRAPVRGVAADEVRYVRMEGTFIAVALYEGVIPLLPNEIGFDAAHEVRLVRNDG